MTSAANNVLFVTIDSLRFDAVFNHQQANNITELAEGGTLYTKAFSQAPFTTFSMPSLFSSRYPSGLKYVDISDRTPGVYIGNTTTLPEQLQSLGYETAGFHSNPLVSSLVGFDRGFEAFDARLPLSGTDWLPGRAKVLTDKVFRLLRKHPYLPAEKLNERALDWLDRRRGDGPFFLWTHYMDVHGPYQAKSGNTYLNKYRAERLWRKALKTPKEITDTERERLRELYRAEVEYTDDCLRRLLDGLQDRGVLNETVVVLTSDHGELFGDYGRYSHPHIIGDQLTHVPLVVNRPGEDGGTVEEIVELIDIPPTIVDLCGGQSPESFEGERLPQSDSSPGSGSSSETAITEAELVPYYHGSVRTGTHRYVRTGEEESLYEVTEGRQTDEDVSDTQSGVRAELSAVLDEHLEGAHRTAGVDGDILRKHIDDARLEDRLEDLGYMK